jgi:Leucine-rich repeat (LRR) protein
VDPNTIFGSLGTIPGLKKLNLSRNKLKRFHSDTLPQDNATLQEQERAFPSLTELNLSFNGVDEEDGLMYPATQIPTLAFLVVTGNPFSITGQQENYDNLEQLLSKRGAVLVNETLNGPTMLRRGGPRGRPPLALPAPTDINNMPKAKRGQPALALVEEADSNQQRQGHVDGA